MKNFRFKTTSSLYLGIGLLFISLFAVNQLQAADLSGSSASFDVIEYVDKSIESTLGSLASETETATDWEIKRVLVRVQSLLGVKIPFFASFQIVPEVEFIIER